MTTSPISPNRCCISIPYVRAVLPMAMADATRSRLGARLDGVSRENLSGVCCVYGLTVRVVDL